MRIRSSSFLIFNVSYRSACVVDSSFLNLGNMQHRQQLHLQPKLAATTAQPQWHPFSFSARPSPLRQQHHQHQSQQHLCNGSSSIQRRQQCSTSEATAKQHQCFSTSTQHRCGITVNSFSNEQRDCQHRTAVVQQYRLFGSCSISNNIGQCSSILASPRESVTR